MIQSILFFSVGFGCDVCELVHARSLASLLCAREHVGRNCFRTLPQLRPKGPIQPTLSTSSCCSASAYCGAPMHSQAHCEPAAPAAGSAAVAAQHVSPSSASICVPSFFFPGAIQLQIIKRTPVRAVQNVTIGQGDNRARRQRSPSDPKMSL